MKSHKIINFAELGHSDLYVDSLYKGGTKGNAGDDPISKLVGCGNQGGFHYIGSVRTGVKLCVLYSSLAEVDWPDTLDSESGLFIYFGDNRSPGHGLHETRRKGNTILRDTFNALHEGNHREIPPFLVFTKGPSGRDVFFRGLAAPGASSISSLEDLVAVWKTKVSQRFQNYKSTFTILDEPVISRNWIQDIQLGNPLSNNAPPSWKTFIKRGNYNPLIAPKTIAHRDKTQQLPEAGFQQGIIQLIIDYFKNHPRREYAFEQCAAEIAKMMDTNIIECDLTRPWRDGGRDAVGKYRIGNPSNALEVDFALEAKCKGFNSGSGVKETSRLISRLRYRQFGIFVSTSYVGLQAYKEIIEDRHPVIIVSGADIAKILIDNGYNSLRKVNSWLQSKFPY